MYTKSWLRRLKTAAFQTLLGSRARRARSAPHRLLTRPRLEQLEDRVVPVVGSWANLAASAGTAPANGGAAMMLLSDGSVLVQNGLNSTGVGGQSASMFKLSPQANTGSYVNGVWSATGSMN